LQPPQNRNIDQGELKFEVGIGSPPITDSPLSSTSNEASYMNEEFKH